MSAFRFFTWLIAVLISAGFGLLIVRYAFSEADWGWDGVWMAVFALALTREVQDALESMWARE